MINNRQKLILALAAILFFSTGITVEAIHRSPSVVELSDEYYSGAEDVLTRYLYGINESDLLSDQRLSQHVTVTTQGRFLPLGGMVSKSKDDFYPGTYVVKFNRHCALPSTARVYVRIEAEPGETVYILTGNKELGYKEHAQVEACGQNLVVFETDRLVDYTISKTDIVSAQEAMENIFARNYDMDDQP